MASPFIQKVERWRLYANTMSDAPQFLIPAGWILAIIQNESGGVAGIPGPTGEAGLMQTKPALVSSFNKATGNNYTFEQMKGTSDADAQRQIIVGTYYLARCRNDVSGMVPPAAGLSTTQVYFADLAYGSGLGALKAHRRATIKAGYPGTFEGMEELAKAGGGSIPLRKFKHARRVVSLLKKDGLANGYNPASYPRAKETVWNPIPTPEPEPEPIGPTPTPEPTPGEKDSRGDGSGLLVLGAVVAAAAFSRRSK